MDPATEFEIKWAGYNEITWEPRSNLHPELVADFEATAALWRNSRETAEHRRAVAAGREILDGMCDSS